jgi:hypothetical protein
MSRSSLLALASLVIAVAGSSPAAADWGAEGSPYRRCLDACEADGGQPRMTLYGNAGWYPICHVEFGSGINVTKYDGWNRVYGCRISAPLEPEDTIFGPYECQCRGWGYRRSQRFQKR